MDGMIIFLQTKYSYAIGEKTRGRVPPNVNNICNWVNQIMNNFNLLFCFSKKKRGVVINVLCKDTDYLSVLAVRTKRQQTYINCGTLPAGKETVCKKNRVLGHFANNEQN